MENIQKSEKVNQIVEEKVLFGESKTLVGIITRPIDSQNTEAQGILFINAGLIHRIGQNRIYTKFARKLAHKKFVALRFDLSGVGDSSSNDSQNTLDARIIKEIQDAMDELQSQFDISNFTLIGCCSGAENSVKAAAVDPRVKKMILINHTSPRPFRYLLRTDLLNPSSWKRSLLGRTHYRDVFVNYTQLIKNVIARKPTELTVETPESSDKLAEVLSAILARNVAILFISSQWDPSLDYLYNVLKTLKRYKYSNTMLSTKVIPEANHDLFGLNQQNTLYDYISEWVDYDLEDDTTSMKKKISSQKSYKAFRLVYNIRYT